MSELTLPMIAMNLMALIVLGAIGWFMVLMGIELVDKFLPFLHCWFTGHDWGGAGWDAHAFNPEVPQDYIRDLWNCCRCRKRVHNDRFFRDRLVEPKAKCPYFESAQILRAVK